MAADATPAVSSLKEQGNASLKQGDLKSACAFYTEALAEALPADEAAAVHCNRALARLKLKETAACIADCSLAIGFQPGYAKAFYRRAQAYEAMGAGRSAAGPVDHGQGSRAGPALHLFAADRL